MFTSRDKDVTLDLFEKYEIKHTTLSAQGSGGFLALGRELVSRNHALYKFVKAEKPDILAAIGGPFIAHVGAMTRTPSIIFYDTENAKLQNLITYPLASCVVVPNCYKGWIPKRHLKYSGLHELSYLHPKYFKPNLEIARKIGLKQNKKNIIIRLVSWKASHDIGEFGWSEELLDELIEYFSPEVNIIISSELSLAKRFHSYLYKGATNDIHHLMAFSDLFIGESATMASESAVLGVPAIYAAQTGRGYTDHLEEEYGLVINLRHIKAGKLKEAVDSMLNRNKQSVEFGHSRLLAGTLDVPEYVADLLHNWR